MSIFGYLMADFRESLGKVNKSLDRVKLRQKGDRLYLRATLPPKPGDGHELAMSGVCAELGLEVQSVG